MAQKLLKHCRKMTEDKTMGVQELSKSKSGFYCLGQKWFPRQGEFQLFDAVHECDKPILICLDFHQNCSSADQNKFCIHQMDLDGHGRTFLSWLKGEKIRHFWGIDLRKWVQCLNFVGANTLLNAKLRDDYVLINLIDPISAYSHGCLWPKYFNKGDSLKVADAILNYDMVDSDWNQFCINHDLGKEFLTFENVKDDDFALYNKIPICVVRLVQSYYSPTEEYKRVFKGISKPMFVGFSCVPKKYGISLLPFEPHTIVVSYHLGRAFKDGIYNALTKEEEEPNNYEFFTDSNSDNLWCISKDRSKFASLQIMVTDVHVPNNYINDSFYNGYKLIYSLQAHHCWVNNLRVELTPDVTNDWLARAHLRHCNLTQEAENAMRKEFITDEDFQKQIYDYPIWLPNVDECLMRTQLIRQGFELYSPQVIIINYKTPTTEILKAITTYNNGILTTPKPYFKGNTTNVEGDARIVKSYI